MVFRAVASFQQRYPKIRLVFISINDRAELGDEGIDVLIRPRSARQRGSEHKPPQGLVLRKLAQSPIAVCASPEYFKRTGMPRTPTDLAQHACLALLTLERDAQDEWQFARLGAREKVSITPTLIAHGEALREAALAGCGIVRLLACNVEDELRTGALVRVLPNWECLGGLPIVAVYRKTRRTLSPINAFVTHLAQVFRRYNQL